MCENTFSVPSVPFSDRVVKFQFNPAGSDVEFDQMSIDGQLIKKANNTNTVDLSYLRNGIYIIKIKNEGETLISKIIKR